MTIETVLVSGYKHTDLGIFSDKDPRIPIIKAAIRRDCIRFLEEGVKWFVLTGNLGFEYWVLEVLMDMRTEGYDLQLATIFPFANHGEQWNEANQAKLALFKSSDFVKYAYPHYQHPGQFKDYNRFLLENTDAAYLFYDNENETNLKYLYNLILTQVGYTVKRLNFDDLNDMAENFIKSD